MKRKQTIVALAVLLLFVVVGALILLWPKHSVTAYCKAYKSEDARLANAHGDSYAVAVFSHRSSDPHDFAVAFANLERVAPSEIQSDVKSLKSIFESIDADPSKALSASVSGLPAEANVKKWTSDHCGKQ